MPDPIRFGCVGGFLGAGKTTALAAAARELKARGHAVGLVANDQGKDLVDTAVFRSLGLPAGEVSGGCFCCRFDDLVAEADRILAAHPVDVLLAGEVGTCPALVATFPRPMRRFFPGRFELLPFSVLVEPGRVDEMSRPKKGVPADVAYVFERQLAEADLLVLTKADLVPDAERADVRRSIESLARGVPVLQTSAASGEGIEAGGDRLVGRRPLADRGLEIDYDA